MLDDLFDVVLDLLFWRGSRWGSIVFLLVLAAVLGAIAYFAI